MPVMNNKNDLHGNRVVRSDDNDQQQAAGTKQTEKYQSARSRKKNDEKQSAQEGVQKAGKTAGAAVGAYFGGSTGAKIGAKVGEKIGNSKIGQRIGKNVAKNPFARKAFAKANDSGAIDAANKGTDLVTNIPSSSNTNIQSSNSPTENSSSTNSGSSPKGNGFFSKPNFLGDDNQEKQASGFSGMFSGFIKINPQTLAIGGFVIGGFFLLLLFIGVAQGSGSISGYDDAFGVSSATNGETGGLDYVSSDPEAEAFFNRVAQVKNSFQMQGKTFNAVYISGVFSVLRDRLDSFSYGDMTTEVITEIANSMFSGNSFSEDTFKQNLISTIFPKYVPNKSQLAYESMANMVFDYYDEYFSLIGSTASNCASAGSCVYEIKGFYIPSRGNITQSLSISDLKVRLMQCGGNFGSGTWGEALAGEELVPFEQYVLGVAYQEIGPNAPDEAIKAQMVAARSYALARPIAINNAMGRKLAQENGQWILQLASCVADQVYCNPDSGCSALNDGEQHGTVKSGVDSGYKLKDPLPADHKMRTLANETMGELLVNDQDYVISTNYVSTDQQEFIRLANEGYNYKQILLQVYNSKNYNASDIDRMSCNTGSGCGTATSSTGPYAGWKQMDPAWGNIRIGNTNQTIAGVGCLVTSVSMLIAKSGVAVNVDGDFNPGTFVQKLNQVGGFSGANFLWASASKVAPNFRFVTKVSVSGQSQSQKLSTLQSLLNQGYYVVAEVKGNTGQHWVAIDGIDGNNILMMDPASQSASMWQQYNWQNTSQFAYFRVV